MLAMTDSFIQFLSAEAGVTVHWVRVTEDSADNLLKMGALNVAILGSYPYDSLEEAMVSLDLVAQSELQGYQWAETVLAKLLERQYIPELDYRTDPESPTATGKTVSWDGNKIKFQVVEAAPLYFHLNASFPICHAR